MRLLDCNSSTHNWMNTLEELISLKYFALYLRIKLEDPLKFYFKLTTVLNYSICMWRFKYTYKCYFNFWTFLSLYVTSQWNLFIQNSVVIFPMEIFHFRKQPTCEFYTLLIFVLYWFAIKSSFLSLLVTLLLCLSIWLLFCCLLIAKHL